MGIPTQRPNQYIETSDWDQRATEAMAGLRPALLAPLSADERAFLQQQFARTARFGASRRNPIVSMSAHIGNFWSGLILVMLRAGPRRPSALRTLINTSLPSMPISDRMLTLNLRNLERDGLIDREIFVTRQTHVEYGLTSMGLALSDFMMAIIDWAIPHYEDVLRAREEFDARGDTLLG